MGTGRRVFHGASSRRRCRRSAYGWTGFRNRTRCSGGSSMGSIAVRLNGRRFLELGWLGYGCIARPSIAEAPSVWPRKVGRHAGSLVFDRCVGSGRVVALGSQPRLSTGQGSSQVAAGRWSGILDSGDCAANGGGTVPGESAWFGIRWPARSVVVALCSRQHRPRQTVFPWCVHGCIRLARLHSWHLWVVGNIPSV